LRPGGALLLPQLAQYSAAFNTLTLSYVERLNLKYYEQGSPALTFGPRFANKFPTLDSVELEIESTTFHGGERRLPSFSEQKTVTIETCIKVFRTYPLLVALSADKLTSGYYVWRRIVWNGPLEQL